MTDERRDEIADLCGKLRGSLPVGSVTELAIESADWLERLLWDLERHETTVDRETRVVGAALDHSIPDGLRLWDILQESSAVWHLTHFPDDDDPRSRMAKLLEEAGELSRAIIADREGRPDRGDIGQEAAQAVLVIMSTLGRCYPHISLIRKVINEMIEAGAITVDKLPWRVTE